jgi:hypothetical protein
MQYQVPRAVKSNFIMLRWIVGKNVQVYRTRLYTVAGDILKQLRIDVKRPRTRLSYANT